MHCESHETLTLLSPPLLDLWRNSLTNCGPQHFNEPILGHIANVPDGIHHVPVAHPENNPKDTRQLRILQPGLRAGLLTSSGETWKVTRRTARSDIRASLVRQHRFD